MPDADAVDCERTDHHSVQDLVGAWRALCKHGCLAPFMAPVGEYCGQGEAILHRASFAHFGMSSAHAAGETAGQICARGVQFRDVCSGDNR